MLVFIDESGHPRPKDPTLRPVELAVCIKESDTGRLTRAVFGMRRSLLGSMRLNKEEEEGKATVFLSRRALTRSQSKRELMDSLFEYLRDFDLTVFGIVMERPPSPIYEGRDLLQTQHRWLLERIDRFMEKEHPGFMAIPVFDGQDPTTNHIFSQSFTNFMARTDAGKAMQHVVPSPLFVDSSITPGIQIADLFAYVVRLNYEHSLYQTSPISDPYLSAIKRYSNIVRSKTRDYERDDGHTWYGIATMDSSKFLTSGP